MMGVHAEMIKAGGDEVFKWLVRLFNACWINGEVPADWKEAMILPLYKRKGERSECSNNRGISLLSVVGKLYRRVLIERVIRKTNDSVSDEQ